MNYFPNNSSPLPFNESMSKFGGINNSLNKLGLDNLADKKRKAIE
jgi:hypothetical protein